ncbi:hypothetical protein [Lyngbya confervoides]|uniref:Uncharacterized protein n=1 Tax=Lyngbya confervoides BDU141951 TaxID=1574623 RepID=A0ABD4SZW6_9CYAN|nr:hypothetical protein [Lyngbya confervoides]MCM1981905.1 hypothetical protein [Lyngbya confervoides BDU141951]
MECLIPPSSRNAVLATVELSPVDEQYLRHRSRYEQQRQAAALRLRRRLVHDRGIFQRRLNQGLSQSLQQDLGLRVQLDARYLKHPEFVAVFNADGQRWVLGYQRSPWGGRWYFRSPQAGKLYSCKPRQLEALLCYALGQQRSSMVPRV